MDTRWGQDLGSALTEVGDRLAAVLPALLVMLALIAIGLVVAVIARALVSRTARVVGFDHAMERGGLAGGLRRGGGLRSPPDVLGGVSFLAVFLLFPRLGLDALGTQGAPVFLLSFVPPLF